jgi:hypothetical protein
LGHLFKIAPDLRQYVATKFNLKKIIIIVLKPNLVIVYVAINPHMVMIQVQVGKNLSKDVLLDGGSGVNIMTKKL